MRWRKFIIVAAVIVVALAVGTYASRSAKRWAQSMSCGNYMCSICFAARTWALDSNGKMPSDFLSMSNELSTPRVLVCPADRSRRAAPNWATRVNRNGNHTAFFNPEAEDTVRAVSHKV
jgi:hypothetical protein